MQKYDDIDILPYDQYKKIQIERSNKKWGAKIKVEKLSEVVSNCVDYIKDSKSICCMGVRSGNEHLVFKSFNCFKYAEVFGVEINPKVIEKGMNTFCYDFNHLPQEWANKFDLIYSNSVDHAYRVNDTLKEWHRVCKDNGYLLIEFSSCGNVSITDPYCFVEDDIPSVVDSNFFVICKVWRIDGQSDSFNCLLRKR